MLTQTHCPKEKTIRKSLCNVTQLLKGDIPKSRNLGILRLSLKVGAVMAKGKNVYSTSTRVAKIKKTENIKF